MLKTHMLYEMSTCTSKRDFTSPSYAVAETCEFDTGSQGRSFNKRQLAGTTQLFILKAQTKTNNSGGQLHGNPQPPMASQSSKMKAGLCLPTCLGMEAKKANMDSLLVSCWPYGRGKGGLGIGASGHLASLDDSSQVVLEPYDLLTG